MKKPTTKKVKAWATIVTGMDLPNAPIGTVLSISHIEPVTTLSIFSVVEGEFRYKDNLIKK